jgi:hypothetical protein
VVGHRGPCVILDQWLCVGASLSVRGTREVAVE